MRVGRWISFLAVLVASSVCTRVPLYAADPALKPEELVAKHLDSIGAAAARAGAKTRAVQGTAAYRIVVGGGGKAEGKTGMVSDGHKIRFMMKFSTDYRGENVLFNGDTLQIAFSTTNQTRSPFAAFLMAQDVIVRDGLLGSVLSTAWPLLDVDGRKPKLVYEGLKKVDGRELHQLRYFPHTHSDVEILVYFEPDTFRHVKSTYSISLGNNVGATITESAALQPERSRLEERFSEFKTADGLTLPTHWNLQFTRELPNGSTTISEWDLKEDQINNNIGLDPRNFEAK
jgi:hypothetical protein